MIVRVLVPLALLAAGLASGSALAQVKPAPQPASKPVEEPTPVSPVTVMPKTQPPKVTATYPEEGQSIAPGVLVLKIAFDQKMEARRWSYGLDAADAPECVKTPRLLADGKTFVLLCRVAPDKTYRVAMNGAPAAGFANEAENPAEPHVLTFQVVRGDPVTTVPRAMAAAGLKDFETPIEDAPKPLSNPTL